jgi:hypothetical protein
MLGFSLFEEFGEGRGWGKTLILTPFLFLLLFLHHLFLSKKCQNSTTFFKFFLDSSLENTKCLARFYIILPHSPSFTNLTMMALL